MLRRRFLIGWGVLPLALLLLSEGQPAFARGGRQAAILAPSNFNYSFGGFGPVGGYGGYYSPGYIAPLLPPAGSYLPPNWWSGQNADSDPRQAGYNPSGGYSWDSVGALLLSTSPPDARVTLDGTYIGTANYLGPIQLPMGEHTIKVEAAGFGASDTTLKVEQPSVLQLKISLGPLKQAAVPPAP